MTKEEYNILFHKEQLNLVAFKRLMDCDEEVLRLINRAVQEEREACANTAGLALLGADKALTDRVLKAIRARG